MIIISYFPHKRLENHELIELTWVKPRPVKMSFIGLGLGLGLARYASDSARSWFDLGLNQALIELNSRARQAGSVWLQSYNYGYHLGKVFECCYQIPMFKWHLHRPLHLFCTKQKLSYIVTYLLSSKWRTSWNYSQSDTENAWFKAGTWLVVWATNQANTLSPPSLLGCIC